MYCKETTNQDIREDFKNEEKSIIYVTGCNSDSRNVRRMRK